MVEQNWDISLKLELKADDEDAVVFLLEEIVGKIKAGDYHGEANHCVGVYEFWLEIFDPAGVDDIQRTGPF